MCAFSVLSSFPKIKQNLNFFKCLFVTPTVHYIYIYTIQIFVHQYELYNLDNVMWNLYTFVCLFVYVFWSCVDSVICHISLPSSPLTGTANNYNLVYIFFAKGIFNNYIISPYPQINVSPYPHKPISSYLIISTSPYLLITINPNPHIPINLHISP